MTIYVDIVFIENLIMNFIIILTESIIIKETKQYVKKIIASAVGAFFYIMYLIVPQISLLQIFVSFVITKISFTSNTIKLWIKHTILFYCISFLFGGVTFAIINFFERVTIINGILYGKFNVLKISLSALISGVLAICAFRKRNKHIFKELVIEINRKKSYVKVLLDTGNLLREPYTNKPVIIVEKDCLKQIVSGKIISNLKNIINGKMELPDGMFFIPYKSIGNQNGVLIGFRPDCVMLKENNKKLENVVIGMCEEKLSDNRLYSGIFGLEIEGIV